MNRHMYTGDVPLSPFAPPGPGEWRIIDHITHPGTRCFAEYYYTPMEDGWNEEARDIGIPNRVRIREVNGFMYYSMDMALRDDEFSEMCRISDGYWEKKQFLNALHLWDESVKPSAIEQLVALQKVPLEALSAGELLEHMQRSIDTTRNMVKNHHRFTYTSLIPIGDFVRQACEWTAKEPLDVLEALRESSPNRLSAVQGESAVQKMLDNLQGNTEALYWLTLVDREPESANRVLAVLMALEGVAEGFRFLLGHVGHHIVSGYDITSETYAERPDLLLKSVKSMISQGDRALLSISEDRIQALRELVPTGRKPLFDELLGDVRTMDRLRYERGMYSELWAVGILRQAFLEAGKRLTLAGTIDTPDMALDASYEELLALLAGMPAVSTEELQRRAQYREQCSVKDVPPVLGTSSTAEPDMSGLPPSMARTLAALATAFALAVEHVPGKEAGPDRLQGVPASRGVVEGIAKVLSSDTQIEEVNRGDILVVHQTTAALDVVFPLLGGIVSQFGGVLSHPAILAREYRVPCVVGCSGAMERLRTGMRIRLDGNTGKVHVLSEGTDDTMQRLESLLCEYRGPMRGRNRSRVYNHLDGVASRLETVRRARKDRDCLEALALHFENAISSEEAVGHVAEGLSTHRPGTKIDNTQEPLRDFVRRYHVEFHPCDACNLTCSGCTYFQDTESKPDAVSFPFEQMAKICSVIQPKAITIAGGGEPVLYRSGDKRLGDLICALGSGDFGCRPAIGLITNGTSWPPGDPNWHHHVEWIRYSLDASTPESFRIGKGKDLFDRVIENVFRALQQTSIAQVGVGFLYHPGNVRECGPVIALLANRIRKLCPDQLHRFNIQFRPWRPPAGRPSISERVLSQRDIEEASAILLDIVEGDSFLEQFTQENTNVAVNLICGGAREVVAPFSECYFGLAKTVIRADGALYPCFRVSAQKDPLFYSGSILQDPPLKLALRELYVAAHSAKQECILEHDKCLFCVFNNMLEDGIADSSQPQVEPPEDYFF